MPTLVYTAIIFPEELEERDLEITGFEVVPPHEDPEVNRINIGMLHIKVNKESESKHIANVAPGGMYTDDGAYKIPIIHRKGSIDDLKHVAKASGITSIITRMEECLNEQKENM